MALSDEMTGGQLVTAVGTLAVKAIHGYHVLLPEHKRVAKKVEKVKAAVLEMYKETGAHIEDEIIDFVSAAWDGTMRKLAADDREYCSRLKVMEAALRAIYTEAMVKRDHPDNDLAMVPENIMERCKVALGVFT